MPFLLVPAFFRHGLGPLPNGSLLQRTLLFLLWLADGAQAQFPAARGAETRSGAASLLGAPGRRLPAVQQGLVAGELVQQWVTGDSSAAVSVEHLKRGQKDF